ncbi:hypothetical protein ACQI4E_26390 [Streptomyces sp. CA-252508]|uniref:hypothetical protein n=1 Tax=Streptomyces sp. CA-252508 TaxID=3418946 RepID=UPI003D90B65C
MPRPATQTSRRVSSRAIASIRRRTPPRSAGGTVVASPPSGRTSAASSRATSSAGTPGFTSTRKVSGRAGGKSAMSAWTSGSLPDVSKDSPTIRRSALRSRCVRRTVSPTSVLVRSRKRVGTTICPLPVIQCPESSAWWPSRASPS